VEHAYLESIGLCPICGGSAWQPYLQVADHTLTKEVFQLTTCAACGFCVTDPRPKPAYIGRYYESPDYISHTNSKAGLQDRLYQIIRGRAIRGKHRLIARYRPNGRVLDMGCGTGEFLRYLKSRGYLTTGIEPSLSAREQAIAGHALEVLPSIDQVPSMEQFQIITLWHVLEHLHDVRTGLKKLHARMAREGLLIIAVPNRESWDAQHYGPDWAAYDVPRHLSHFRRQDIHRLLKEHGFSMLDTRPMWFDAPYVAMLSERYRGAAPTTALLKGGLAGMASNLVAATTSRPTSSTLYIAKKG